MAVELKIPEVGESVTEVHIGPWKKDSGEWVDRDEPVVELESDKATVELPAPIAGNITKILKREGDTAEIGEVIGYMEESAKPSDGKPAEKKQANLKRDKKEEESTLPPPSKPEREREPEVSGEEQTKIRAPKEEPRVTPAARRVLAEHDLTVDDVNGSGPGGRVLKEDVMRTVSEERLRKDEETAKAEEPPKAELKKSPAGGTRDEESVPMTPMRRRIAERLVDAQHTGALLTTFNEIDMGDVIALREEHRDEFQEKHGVKLGFTSFFVKASVEALKAFPKVNAEIRQEDIVYHHYYDIGIAVSSAKGLVVPVLRNAEGMSFGEIEEQIADFGARAKENKIKLEELEGGTFTISNGGVYGSLLSTPIINPPQSGILGLHVIQDRPVAQDGQVVIRPMMYVAFTYDHRIVDGREAVTFLRRIKESIEKPARLLLEL